MEVLALHPAEALVLGDGRDTDIRHEPPEPRAPPLERLHSRRLGRHRSSDFRFHLQPYFRPPWGARQTDAVECGVARKSWDGYGAEHAHSA